MAIARPIDRRLFLLLDRARNRLFKRANRKLLHSANITVSQGAALFYMSRHDGCLLSDLAEGLDLNNSAITGLAMRMEKNGLIERRPCPEDGRAMRAHLTEKGRAAHESVKEALRGFNTEIERGFTPQEMDVVYRFLARTADVPMV
jgi:MarR family transcriptional regulator, organic hydroperoxide resistance regulator